MHGTLHPSARAFRDAMDTAPIAPLLRDCRRILAAYSGGGDSAALLVLLAKYCAQAGISLVAVHVHHGIRGEEADRDAAFCAEFCSTRGISFRLEHVDAPLYSERYSVGIEEAARTLRYEVLARIADEEEGTLIATAHSADDNLETVLFRLVRGTALDGLIGIPPVRGNIIRPLLACTGQQLRDYCNVEGGAYVTDSTNTDTAYTRNYIRSEIVPCLSRIAPEPSAAVLRMCESLRSDADLLRSMAEEALGHTVHETSVSVDRLQVLHDAILSRCIMILYENAAGTRRDLTARHIRDVMHAVRTGGFVRISLPGEITAVIAGGLLRMQRGRAEIPQPDTDFAAALVFGKNLFPQHGFGICMELSEAEEFSAKEEDCQNVYKLSTRTSLPFDTIKGTVFVRFRGGGDRIRFGGMTRSVKKLLSTAGIPPADRARLPIVCDDEGILWIPGLPHRDVLHERSGQKTVSITYFLL